MKRLTRGEITRLLINIPPGHAKSLLVSVLWPAWTWTFNPAWRGLFASYAYDLAERDSVRCRTLIRSDWYRGFMEAGGWKIVDDQDTKGYFVNTASGFRFSTSIEAQAHQEDLSGHVLAQGGYEHRCLPSEFDPASRAVTSKTVRGERTEFWRDPRTTEDELPFPALFPQSVLEQAKKDLGSSGYAGQHDQRPTPEGRRDVPASVVALLAARGSRGQRTLPAAAWMLGGAGPRLAPDGPHRHLPRRGIQGDGLDGVPWLDDFLGEVSAFPRGRHDDQVDALTQALLDLANQSRNLERFRMLSTW